MPRPFPFDAVLFDLDGTLVATDRFWAQAARVGARRAFAELGLEREPPEAAAWMSMVGLPLDQGFALVFPDLDDTQRALLQARCVEEEESALRAGRAALLPGAREVLATLRERGVRTGIASNCGRGYLEHMLAHLPLGDWIDEARCLDSPGVASKADMIADLLDVFGTRSAVMVGDRATDAEAARAHGVPALHLASGFARHDERVPADAVLGDLGDLLPRLEARAQWIEDARRRLRVGERRTLAITGPPRVGCTLFARDLARQERAADGSPDARGGRGRAVVVAPAPDPGAPHEAAAFAERVLGPHRRGEPARLPDGTPLAPDGLLVVEGPGLQHPLLTLGFDATLALTAAPEVLRRRSGAAEPAPDPFARPGRATLALDASNPLGPDPSA